MSDGVYTRGAWHPLPREEESLHTTKNRGGLALLWAVACMAAALLGILVFRRARREKGHG